MATLNLNEKKIPSAENLRLIAQLCISLANKQSSLEDRCIAPWKSGEVYQKDISYVSYNNYLYFCTVSNSDTDFVESHWTKLSDTISELTKSDIEALVNLTPEQIANLQSLIDDTSISTTHTNSSSHIYMAIQDAIAECKDDTLKQIAKKVSGSYKIANTTADIVSADYIYLLSNGTNYDLYVLVDGTATKVGDTNIDLSEYIKATDLADYMKTSDADGKFATITTVDGKIDKTNIIIGKDNSATDDQVYSAKAINTELDKKANKTDIEEVNIVNLMPFPYDSSIISENSGITFKVDDEGAIHVSGTKTTDNLVQYYPIRDTVGTSGYLIDTFEVGKTYTLSGCPSGGSTKTYRLRILFNYDKSSEGLTSYQYIDTGAGVTFTIESEIKYMRIMIDYSGATNTTYGDLIFKPQITEGNKVIDFKASLNRNNLSQLKNTVTSTINGLNGRIPINSGEDMDNITTIGFYSVLSGAIALTVSNLPIKSACFVDVYGNNHTVGKGWGVQEIKASNSADAPIYRRSRIHEGNWGQWQRLCTTIVADVTRTFIPFTPPSNMTIYNPDRPDLFGLYYIIKNGICYVDVTMAISSVGELNGFVSICSGLPKPAISYVRNESNSWNDKTAPTLGMAINGDSNELLLSAYNLSSTATANNSQGYFGYFKSFSYPVAES